jgi:hypothetical protein
MQGIFPYLVPIVTIVVLGAFALNRRHPPATDMTHGNCTNCETPMSMRRVSILELLTLRGVWMCPHCGARLYKRRGKVTGTTA